MTSFMEIKRRLNKKLALAIMLGVSLIAMVVSIACSPTGTPGFAPKIEGVERFASEEEFKTYLEEAAGIQYYGFGTSLPMPMMPMLVPPPQSEFEARGGDMKGGTAVIPDRVSGTTVQVIGIDEPDIVKTDGKEIYFSQSYIWRPWEGPMLEEKIWPVPEEGKTRVIRAFPPEDLAVESSIGKQGDLLLVEDVLVMFSGDRVYGYDVSDPESPQKEWDVKLGSGTSLVGARLYKNKIYLVTQTSINVVDPWPIRPLSANGVPLTIDYREIYHPLVPIPADVTFVAMVLDPGSGEIEKDISFVGPSASSIIYMSAESIYVTYSYFESVTRFLPDFFRKEASDLIPSWLVSKLEKLEGYDISQQARLTEFQVLWQGYLNSLDSDERLRIENEIADRMTDYYKKHVRDLERTGIIRMTLDGFKLDASGNVPGRPLNQFALDEYDGHLRVATTVGEGFGFGFGTGVSANDVYVLDENLDIQGAVKGLGLTERIYSVRFIEDKGYVVTFRQTDPFYVLDLSDPQSPELKGELKIPGYSSYLQPISKDRILGIGQEGWQVKISLFNVSRAERPKELDKYLLDESWSDVLQTHHAFLLDKKHEVFFLPGSNGGYVFSYEDDELSLTRAVSDISARRAIFLDDYMYIIGDSGIVVLDENTWKKVEELEF
jgi:uncharacterized secreted protein with C-terminal beta-propeller domain